MNEQLRPYQSDAVHQCFGRWERNVLNLLGVAAVGAGKTIIASTIMKLHLNSPEKRVLFLAHREELLGQTVEKLAMIDDRIVSGIQQGRHVCPPDAKVMVASIATSLSGIHRINSIRTDSERRRARSIRISFSKPRSWNRAI